MQVGVSGIGMGGASWVHGGREGGQSRGSDEGDREGAVRGLMGRVGGYTALGWRGGGVHGTVAGMRG